MLAEFAGQGFGVFKPKLAELAVSSLAPVTAEMRRLMADPAEIDRVLKAGAERAADDRRSGGGRGQEASSASGAPDYLIPLFPTAL